MVGKVLVAPASSRQHWVDVARGIGIVLVVWGHIVRGHIDLQATPWAAEQDRWIYAFHMPLFFMLAGLFLWPAVGRGRADFLRRRWWAIIWPYILWSVMIGLIEVAMSPFVNSPIGFRDVGLILFRPIEQFWFLYALLICQVMVLVAWPSMTRLWLIVLAGVALLTVTGGPWIGIRAFEFLPYVAAGVASVHALSALARASAHLQFGMAAVGWGVFAAMLLWFPFVQYGLIGRLLPGALGTFACAATAMLLARRDHSLSAALTVLGHASLAIFVLHTLFSAGTRIALKMIEIAPADPLSLMLCFVSGLILPIIIYRFAVARGLARQLGFGGASGRPASAMAAPASSVRSLLPNSRISK